MIIKSNVDLYLDTHITKKIARELSFQNGEGCGDSV